MILSKYVNSIKKDNNYILYHSQIGGACIVDEKIYGILNGIENEELNNKPDLMEVVDEFRLKGFLVNEEVDILENITESRMNEIGSGKQIKTLQLVVSNTCNFKCKYCFENSIYCSPEREKYQNDLNNKIMSDIDAIKYVKYVMNVIRNNTEKAYLHIQFFGGEPLTNKNAIKAVLNEFGNGESYGLELSYSIVTNGSLIDDEMADYFLKYKVGVIVSFDNPKKTDRYMKSGKNSIEKTFEILGLLKEKGVYVAFNSVLSKHTFEYFDRDIIDCALEYNVREVGIVLDLDPSFYVENHIKDIALKILDIVDYGKEKGIPVSGYWMSSYLSILGDIECSKGFKTCSGTGSQFSIEPNGTVFACKGSSGYFGNIRDIDSIFSNDNYRKYASRGVINSTYCNDCEIAGFCSGFCLGPLEQSYQDIHYVVPQYCELIKFLIKELLLREKEIDKYEY